MNSTIDNLFVLYRLELSLGGDKQENLRNFNKVYIIFSPDQEKPIKELQKQNTFDLDEFDPTRVFVIGEKKKNKQLDEIGRREELYDKMIIENESKGLEDKAQEDEVLKNYQISFPELLSKSKTDTQDLFIPGSIGYYLSRPRNEIRNLIKEGHKGFEIGMRRYLAIESIPHSLIVAHSFSEKGLGIDDIPHLTEVDVPKDEMSTILKKLKSFSLIYQKGNRIYPSSHAEAIYRDSGFIQS